MEFVSFFLSFFFLSQVSQRHWVGRQVWITNALWHYLRICLRTEKNNKNLGQNSQLLCQELQLGTSTCHSSNGYTARTQRTWNNFHTSKNLTATWYTCKMGLQLLRRIHYYIANLTLQDPCFLIPCEGLTATLKLLQYLLRFNLHNNNHHFLHSAYVTPSP